MRSSNPSFCKPLFFIPIIIIIIVWLLITYCKHKWCCDTTIQVYCVYGILCMFSST